VVKDWVFHRWRKEGAFEDPMGLEMVNTENYAINNNVVNHNMKNTKGIVSQ
jgi:hypothetical protein